MIPERRTELLPCPFCGGLPVTEEHPPHRHVFATFMPDHLGSWTIECSACGSGMIAETLEVVTERWNRRATEPVGDGEAASVVRVLHAIADTETSDTAARAARKAADLIERQARANGRLLKRLRDAGLSHEFEALNGDEQREPTP